MRVATTWKTTTEQVEQELSDRIGAELRDIADRVEPHAVRRGTTPGGRRREVTLTPLLEEWDGSASSHDGPCPDWNRSPDQRALG